jgi:hypothetical protein
MQWETVLNDFQMPETASSLISPDEFGQQISISVNINVISGEIYLK